MTNSTARMAFRRALRQYDIGAIAASYPRLVRAMCWYSILSITEACAAIRDYKRGSNWSGEAVDHAGGTRCVIRDAVAWRHSIRRLEHALQQKN